MSLIGWKYYSEIPVSNSNSTALTDYQVKIELNSTNFNFSLVNSDGSDIRFSEDNGATTIPYWIENWDSANQTAIVWVKVSSIDANNSKTIRMYFGNVSATSESNIKATSLWNQGDDFNDNSRDTTIWDTDIVGTGSPNETNQRLETYVPASGDYAGYVSVNSHSGYNFEIQMLGHNTITQGISMYIHTTKVTTDIPYGYDDWYRVMLYHNGGYSNLFYVQKRISGTVTTLYSGTWLNSEEIVKIKVIGDTIELYEQDTLRASETYALGSRDIYIYVDGSAGTYPGTDWLDNVWIRKCTDTEPTYTIGSATVVTSKLSGTVCDKLGNAITGKVVDIAFFDKDTKELLHTAQSNSTDGTWIDDQIPVEDSTKVIAAYTLEDTYNGDTDIAGAEFATTTPKD